MNIRRKIATAAFTGVLLVGSAAPAFAGGNKHGDHGPKDPGTFTPVTCPEGTVIRWGKDGYWCRPVPPKHGHRPCPDHKGGHHGPKCPDYKGGNHKRPVRPKRPVQKAPIRRAHPQTGASTALFALGGGLLAATGGTVLVSQKRKNA